MENPVELVGKIGLFFYYFLFIFHMKDTNRSIDTYSKLFCFGFLALSIQQYVFVLLQSSYILILVQFVTKNDRCSSL